MNKQLWQPTQAFIDQSNLKHYEQWLLKEKGLSFASYAELWKWSTTEIADFWESIWQYFQVKSYTPYTEVLSGGEMPDTEWFKGATLNYAEHIFRKASDTRPALIFQNETGVAQEISWAELTKKVVAMRHYLQTLGIDQGDRVVAYLPNIPEANIAFLAVNSLGAIWSCCSPDFGVNTVIDRFSQIEPKVFIAADGYTYNQKPFSRLSEIGQIRSQIPSITQTIFIPYLDQSLGNQGENTILWDEVMKGFGDGQTLSFTPVPFDHPIWVLYSSGTTGKPKAITHSHGGMLLEHFKYMAFHNDAHEGENFFWFSTTGWMMWNFLQASMLVGATPVIFDGSPGYPSINVLWEMAEKLPIHHFGTSAPYLVACMKKELSPGKTYDLSNLRSIGSTGAPLPPEAFDWVYEHVSSDVWLCSMSGGTDVCTAFVGGCPYEPVYRGSIQCRGLGCALEAYGDDGQPVINSLGEMVIEQPMPSMPIYFWNDDNKVRYRSSYFEEYPGKWRHGDWIHLYENGSLIIQGRSDATLNRKGIRIGTAEIYAVLDGITGLADSMVLNLEKEGGDDVMPLFVVLEEGKTLSEEMKKAINSALRKHCSPRHVPDFIEAVSGIPYTLSGKKMEVPVKKILMGMDAGKNMNKDAVRNPEAIAFFMEYAKSFRKRYLGAS